MGKVLNALAAVYRSQNNGFPQATSYQPSQVIEHQLSRTCPLSDAGQPYGGDASHTVADVTQKGLREKYSQVSQSCSPQTKKLHYMQNIDLAMTVDLIIGLCSCIKA